jgi:hypothetical protein
MGVYEVEIPTTTAVGEDIAKGKKWQLDPKKARKVVRVGLLGSAAIRDTKVTIHYGTDHVITLYNTSITAGFQKTKLYWHTSHFKCPRGVPIAVIVEDIPNTNSAWLYLDIR